MKIITAVTSLALTVALGAALSPSVQAGGVVVGFEFAVNTGGWTYGPPATFPTSGGNPAAYMFSSVDTFAPQLRTTGAGSPFSGNFRANGVDSVGVDLLTVSTQFPAARPLALILSGGGCQVYFLGTEQVPQPGAGWKSFDFAVPSQSTVMPPGWAVLNGCAGPNVAWNNVITNVSEVRFFYGDPTNFFIFDIWQVGADNARISSTVWANLGNALGGLQGLPVLSCWGPLTSGSNVQLSLQNARTGSSSTLIVGLGALNAPFKGGVLVPQPDILIAGLPTGATGQVVLNSAWPAGLPSGLSLYFQHWITDSGAPFGLAASNAMRGTTP
ncbi:MAG: hypothetical protein ACT4PU_06055 [Planctomycetota bacterium]